MDKRKPLLYKRITRERDLRFVFYPTTDLLDTKNFRKITKVRSILLTDDNRVCMVSNEGINNWMIPGGTLEFQENPIIALKREISEEADVVISEYKLLGFLSVRITNKADDYIKNQDEMIFVAKIDEVQPQTTDPAKGYILKRSFFTIEDMCFKFMKWGKISEYFYNEMKKSDLFE